MPNVKDMNMDALERVARASKGLTYRPMVLSDETRVRRTRRGSRTVVRTWVPA